MSLYHSAQNCEILGSHNSVTEDWSLQECDTVSVGNGAWHSEGLWGPSCSESSTTILWNIKSHSPNNRASHLRRLNSSVNRIITGWLNWLHCSEKHCLAIHIYYYDCIITCPTRCKSDINFQMGNHKPLWVVLSTHSPCGAVPWLTLWAAES